MRRSIGVTVLLTLAGCAVGPKYERPAVQVPKDFRVEVPSAEATSAADVAWWELFKDPVLDGLIREALASNQDLVGATARVEQARALAGVAQADFWPQIGLDLGGQYGQLMSKNAQTQLGVVPRGPAPSYAGALGLSWEIDIWGKVRNASTAAVADLMASEDARRGVLITLVAEVATAYIELREYDRQLEIALKNTALRQETLDLFVTRTQGGVGNNLEVDRARANLAVTAAAIPATRRMVVLKENQLSALLGRPPGPIARSDSKGLPSSPAMPPGAPAALLERRPDVLAAEQKAIAANARVGVAIANRLPSLSLSGIIGLASPNIGNIFSANSLVWTVGGSIFQPLFEGFRLSSEQEAAVARYAEAVASYKQAVITAFREVSDTAVSVKEFGDVRQEKEKEVAALLDAEELALLRFQTGISTYLEVIDAQRSAFQAELELAQAVRDELVSAVLLYRALGGGWQAPLPPKDGDSKKAASEVRPAGAG
ncbi:MAG TPA: efflux transporter outer membrane subunit [Anaeromyxobacteraceae bacterium]|nr:efflux transporter outer membrane subunit [Anaeromyxobacteraceae bacterium]